MFLLKPFYAVRHNTPAWRYIFSGKQDTITVNHGGFFLSKAEIFKPKAAIFDMDGLMLDTERPMVKAWIRAGEIVGWNITETVAIHTIGLNNDDIRRQCMKDLGDDFPYDKFDVILHRLFDEEFAKGIAHKEGLLDLLNYLKTNRIPMVVATSSSTKSAFNKMKIAGITDFFHFAACGDEVANGKPAPDIFLKAAEKIGVPPGDCAGLEDSSAGLKALAAAGIHSIFIKDLIEPPAEVLAAVWKRLNNLREVIPLF